LYAFWAPYQTQSQSNMVLSEHKNQTRGLYRSSLAMVGHSQARRPGPARCSESNMPRTFRRALARWRQSQKCAGLGSCRHAATGELPPSATAHKVELHPPPPRKCSTKCLQERYCIALATPFLQSILYLERREGGGWQHHFFSIFLF
jgi:hypothetical protein